MKLPSLTHAPFWIRASLVTALCIMAAGALLKSAILAFLGIVAIVAFAALAANYAKTAPSYEPSQLLLWLWKMRGRLAK